MQAFKLRVLEEKRLLDEKIERLSAFVDGGVFTAVTEAEQDRLKRQLKLMQEYSSVLGERIAAFPPK